MSPAKPTVRPIAPLTWSVSLRSHRATVSRVEGLSYGHQAFTDTITIHGTDGAGYTFVLTLSSVRSEQEVLAVVLAYFAAVEDAQVYCDGLLSGRLLLSKQQAKSLEATMLALSRGYGPAALSREGVFVTVVPGIFAHYSGTERGHTRQVAARAYMVGDRCVVDSYNLMYLGSVTKITAKYIWCQQDYRTAKKRHSFDSFRMYNRESVEAAAAHNAEEKMYI